MTPGGVRPIKKRTGGFGGALGTGTWELSVPPHLVVWNAHTCNQAYNSVGFGVVGDPSGGEGGGGGQRNWDPYLRPGLWNWDQTFAVGGRGGLWNWDPWGGYGTGNCTIYIYIYIYGPALALTPPFEDCLLL